jgi:hypothetical protein
VNRLCTLVDCLADKNRLIVGTLQHKSWPLSVIENARCAFAFLLRKGLRHTDAASFKAQPLEVRLAAEAIQLREQAKLLPPGATRDAVIRKARQAETGSHVSEWLRSPGLQPLK